MNRGHQVCSGSGEKILLDYDTNGYDSCSECKRLVKMRNIHDFTVYSNGDHGEFIRTDTYGTVPRHFSRPKAVHEKIVAAAEYGPETIHERVERIQK